MAEDPIDPKIKSQMNRLAEVLEGHLKPLGFALFVFEMNPPPGVHQTRFNYISNAPRAGMLAVLKGFIAKNEGRLHKGPEGKQ